MKWSRNVSVPATHSSFHPSSSSRLPALRRHSLGRWCRQIPSHENTHACTHARTHARTHTHTHHLLYEENKSKQNIWVRKPISKTEKNNEQFTKKSFHDNQTKPLQAKNLTHLPGNNFGCCDVTLLTQSDKITKRRHSVCSWQTNRRYHLVKFSNKSILSTAKHWNQMKTFCLFPTNRQNTPFTQNLLSIHCYCCILVKQFPQSTCLTSRIVHKSHSS